MLKLRDIMTRDVVTIDPDLSIRDAMELLASRHISGAPVMAGMRVVGVISLTDLAEFAASLPGTPTERQRESGENASEIAIDLEGTPDAVFFTEMWGDSGAASVERFAAASGPEWNVLEEHTVSEAMTRAVRALPPGTDVLEAAAIMTAAGVHRILVMEGKRLVGIVSLTDIAKAAGAHKLSPRTYVFGHAASFGGRGRSSPRP